MPADRNDTNDPLALIGNLSNRESQVLLGYLKGKKPRDIASELELSPKTVDTYRASILRKLNAQNIPELLIHIARHHPSFLDQAQAIADITQATVANSLRQIFAQETTPLPSQASPDPTNPFMGLDQLALDGWI